jgi:urease accessory protein
MNLINGNLRNPNIVLATIELKVDRFKLTKRRWRASADDGSDFGFELDEPLKHGDCFHQTAENIYRIAQLPEAVLEIDYTDNPNDGLRVGWSIGNLHMPMQVAGPIIRVADDPAIRQLFSHLGVDYTEKTEVFQSNRVSTEIRGHGHTHSHDSGEPEHVHSHLHSHSHGPDEHAH